MSGLGLLALLVLMAEPGPGDGWKQTGKVDGVTVYSRPRSGDLSELMGIGTFDAPPTEVWRAIHDYSSYTRNMPYIEHVKRLESAEPGHHYVYYRATPPLIARRDYVLKVVDESKWEDGKGYFKLTWSVAPNHHGVPPIDDVVRLSTNTGYWLLTPQDGGKRTRATYFIFTDPGGSVPKFIVNAANSTAVPDIFKGIRKGLRKPAK